MKKNASNRPHISDLKIIELTPRQQPFGVSELVPLVVDRHISPRFVDKAVDNESLKKKFEERLVRFGIELGTYYSGFARYGKTQTVMAMYLEYLDRYRNRVTRGLSRGVIFPANTF